MGYVKYVLPLRVLRTQGRGVPPVGVGVWRTRSTHITYWMYAFCRINAALGVLYSVFWDWGTS
jgi:hypothetical protein